MKKWTFVGLVCMVLAFVALAVQQMRLTALARRNESLVMTLSSRENALALVRARLRDDSLALAASPQSVLELPTPASAAIPSPADERPSIIEELEPALTRPPNTRKYSLYRAFTEMPQDVQERVGQSCIDPNNRIDLFAVGDSGHTALIVTPAIQESNDPHVLRFAEECLGAFYNMEEVIHTYLAESLSDGQLPVFPTLHQAENYAQHQLKGKGIVRETDEGWCVLDYAKIRERDDYQFYEAVHELAEKRLLERKLRLTFFGFPTM